MNKQEVLLEITNTQKYYVNELIKIITKKNKTYEELKEINFTSPIGTGKTVMMAMLMNELPNYFFVVTTLSKGQLKKQVADSLKKRVNVSNFLLYGTNDFTKNTIRQGEDFEKELPNNKKIIWIRDEGHIATNRWQEILRSKAETIINFSATNLVHSGIQCNFTHTMMLRTVTQKSGTIQDAIEMLKIVKANHSTVKNYNPCALFRIMDDDFAKEAEKYCVSQNLKTINITDESFDMATLCEDNNEYDVIINKFKITEGIDLKRCHVIYMDNKPTNESTVVQIIGRSRRNALLWRNDIDIFLPENEELLKNTRRSYIFYNIPETIIEQDDNGELAFSLCDIVSVEALKPNTIIEVENGEMLNGLKVIELENKTGKYLISQDPNTGFNVVDNPDFYKEVIINKNNLKFENFPEMNIRCIQFKESINEVFNLTSKKRKIFDRYRYTYFFYEALIEQYKEIEFDKEYWREYLQISNNEPVDPRKLKELQKYFDSQKWYRYGLSNTYEITSQKRIDEIYRKSYIETTSNKIVEILIYNKEKDAWIINPILVPHIEHIEYFNVALWEKIRKLVSKRNNIRTYKHGKFVVLDHPTLSAISKELGDINNTKALATLKARVKKNPNFMDCPNSTWQKLLKYNRSLYSLDEMGQTNMSLEELNSFYSLGLTQKEINEFEDGVSFQIIPSDNISSLNIYSIDVTQKRIYSPCGEQTIYLREHEAFSNFHYLPYVSIANNKEQSIVGVDTMRLSKNGFVEQKPVTSKIIQFSKLERFIESKYSKQLEDSKHKYINGNVDLKLTKRCNSCLGFCVEYFAKLILYKDNRFKKYVFKALRDAGCREITDTVLVGATFLMYKEQMKDAFNIKSNRSNMISMSELVKQNYKSFVEYVTYYGNKVADFIDKTFSKKEIEDFCNHDPNLSVNHITALADFMNENTILDIKCTPGITEKHVKQVLAYHYLSKYRSDLKITKLIIYNPLINDSISLNVD